MQLSLHMLGPLQIAVDDKPISESRSKKIEALLVYLALESDRTHRRENLVGLLFGSMPDESARTNLRQTLTRLRRAIKDQAAHPPFLLTNRESTQFNRESHYFLDVVQFAAALQGCPEHQGQRNGRCADCMARLDQGLKLYRGPFLDGFFLEDSPQFDDWLLIRRENLQQLMLTGLQELATYHENRGYYALAHPYVQRRLEIEPWDEAALRQLLRLLIYQGQRGVALARYQTFARMLEGELGVTPEPETTILRDQIVAGKEKRPAQIPARKQSLIGRSDVLGQIRQRLVDPTCRLVTLLGPGGIGKTRLAIETGWHVAADRIGPFWYGVYFVPLSGIVPGEGPGGMFNPLVTAVAEAIGFTFAGKDDPHSQLLSYLHDKSLLLILDNFEHLGEAGRTFLLALLSQTAELKMLVTSRERLNISGDWTLKVKGLPAPIESLTNETDEASAPALFSQRARQVDADFSIDGAGEKGRCSPTAVSRICQLLNGNPLAIELAAAWVRLLTCDEIAQEIQQNLDLLTSQAHDVPDRHRSMRAVFAHSWQLLTPEEQLAARRLSVFRGGFNREAARAVAGATLPQLAALLDKSLLQRNDVNIGNLVNSHPVSRYHMLETLQQFAHEELIANPVQAHTLQEKHTAFYLDFLQRREVDLQGQNQQTALREIRLEIENIRLAWQKGLDQANWMAIDNAVAALSLFYYMRSWFAEAAELFTQTVARLENAENVSTDRLRGKLLARQGWFTFLLGNSKQAKTLLELSRELLRPFPTSVDHVYSLVFLAVVTSDQGDFATANQLAMKGLKLSQALADRYYEAIANNILSQIAFVQGNYDAARSHSETSLALEREIGNRWSMGFSLVNLGRVAFSQSQFTAAQSCYEESLAIRESLQDKRGQAICHRYLGDTAQAMGHLTTAADHYQSSLVLSREIYSQTGIIFALNRLGNLRLEEGKNRQAQSAFYESLKLAHKSQATSQLITTLLGIATLFAIEDPAKSLALARLIMAHPATTPDQKAQVSYQQESLANVPAYEAWLAHPLDAVIEEILS